MARRTLIQQSRGKSSKAKAEWHELTGAGKRKVKRPFFGLNRQDEDAITARIEDGLDRLLKETR
jgi:phage gpG-like protein